ncbi:MAG: fumarylacetoacetate hydrolase family protein [Microbacterium sp.]|uniref:fumarylacetoacetate hydrolase family protein n=1 Tax=Microbacterium sp. TaxID=51671 RepID=UPI0039E29C45
MPWDTVETTATGGFMRFVSCTLDDEEFAALVDGDDLIPLRGVRELGAATPTALLNDPPLVERRRLPRESVTLRPVVPAPAKIICVGLNYRAHIEETRRDDSDYPVLFTKFATSLVGPYDDIVVPPESERVDWEGEIAVVIGTPARRVTRAAALDHVAGYTIANDVSMRDFQRFTHQWLPGKAWDRATPLGPELVTPDETPAPADLRLTVTYDGEVVQDSTADLLIFDVATLISTISTFATLLPGDVILTGTPGGVGDRRDPPRYLRPGGRVSVEVSGLGRIDNRLVVG